MASPQDNYIDKLFAEPGETPEQELVRQLLKSILLSKTDTDKIRVSGDLIKYVRDQVLTSLAGIRRQAAISARSTMSPDEIAIATGLSKVAVSRLITERKNY